MKDDPPDNEKAGGPAGASRLDFAESFESSRGVTPRPDDTPEPDELDAEVDDIEKLIRRGLAFTILFTKIDAGIREGSTLSQMQQRFLNFVALCHLARVEWCEGRGLRELAADCGVSHETLRRYGSRMLAEIQIAHPRQLAPEHLEAPAIAATRRPHVRRKKGAA